MDILKRAYLNTKRDAEPEININDFHERVRQEVIRLIKVGAYRPQDWPRELGAFPDELRKSKVRGGKHEK